MYHVYCLFYLVSQIYNWKYNACVCCRYKIEKSKDGLWGATEEDGSWNGMVGAVHRGVFVLRLLKYLQYTIECSYIINSNSCCSPYTGFQLTHASNTRWPLWRSQGTPRWGPFVLSSVLKIYTPKYKTTQYGAICFKCCNPHYMKHTPCRAQTMPLCLRPDIIIVEDYI